MGLALSQLSFYLRQDPTHLLPQAGGRNQVTLAETLALDRTVHPFGGGSILLYASMPPPTLIYLHR